MTIKLFFDRLHARTLESEAAETRNEEEYDADTHQLPPWAPKCIVANRDDLAQ